MQIVSTSKSVDKPEIHRNITHLDRENARRFKNIWHRKKRDLELTQIKAAEALGISQASFSQYLNCVIALNTDFILKVAKLLEVSPDDIDPSLRYTLVHRRDPIKQQSVPVLFSFGGILKGPTMIEVPIILEREQQPEILYAVFIAESGGTVPEGAYLIIDPIAQTRVGSLVLITQTDGRQLWGKITRRVEAGTYIKYKIDTGEEVFVDNEHVFSEHKIHSIQYPD